jgi:hypothetical protein
LRSPRSPRRPLSPPTPRSPRTERVLLRGRLESRLNPFRKPHYLLLNLALGGYGNKIDGTSVFPMEFKVDYVRYYQRGT